jgi:hypothetical protein
MSTFQHLQRDIYGDSGIYALYPFDSPLVRKKGVFKIGMALNFDRRLHQYDTGSPAGVYVVAYLKNPLKGVVLVGSDEQKKQIKTKHYKVVEKFIQDYVTENGGKNHLMQIRNNGKTEWFHCSIDLLDEAFKKAKKKYGGSLTLFEIEKMEKIPVKPYYTGTINLYDKPVREYK